MSEGSNRSRVTGVSTGWARDLFEAGLNEAAVWLSTVYGGSTATMMVR
jgi:hypothetical protein